MKQFFLEWLDKLTIVCRSSVCWSCQKLEPVGGHPQFTTARCHFLAEGT